MTGALDTHGALAGSQCRMIGHAALRRFGALRRLAAGDGVGAGDIVAVQLPNWWEFVVTSLACNRIGAVVLVPGVPGRRRGHALLAIPARARLQRRAHRAPDRRSGSSCSGSTTRSTWRRWTTTRR